MFTIIIITCNVVKQSQTSMKVGKYMDLPAGHQEFTRRGSLETDQYQKRPIQPNSDEEPAFWKSPLLVVVPDSSLWLSLTCCGPTQGPPPHTLGRAQGHSRIGVCISCHPLKCLSYHLEWLLTCRYLVLPIFSSPTTYMLSVLKRIESVLKHRFHYYSGMSRPIDQKTTAT